jgi:ribonucleoside-diphosphate reductase alpha subunit
MSNVKVSHDLNMYVKKRSGEREEMSFDKIIQRIKKLSFFENMDIRPLNVNAADLTRKVIEQLYDDIETHKIDELTSEICASMATKHIDYATMASRILISNHHKDTKYTFADSMDKLYTFKDIHNKQTPLISKEVYDISQKYSELIEEHIDYSKDYLFDYFGFKTLERAYLMRVNGVIVERPQHMWMRVSIGIHGEKMDRVFETYNAMSDKYFTHATPTLFNSGTPRPQMSSCYLIAMEDDSIKGMYNTLGDCAAISKWSGGIGLHIHNIRGEGSHIRGTNGKSNGIVPLLKVFNSTARHVNQGGKRNGFFAIYLEPWHPDIENFLQMRKNHGDEEMKARDLFYALWIPDLFMERVANNQNWTLMCPDQCPGLSDVYGNEFKQLYERYEKEQKGNKTISARKLWFELLDSQIETGTPYMLYKDRANQRSNQKNIGTIKSSNLCTEILEYSNDKETAVCNLASIGLSKFVERVDPKSDQFNDIKIYSRDGCVYCKLAKYELDKNGISYTEIDVSDDVTRKQHYEEWSSQTGKSINSVPQIWFGDKHIGGYEELLNVVQPTFNFEKLYTMTRIITRNLNSIIDKNFYPTDKTYRSNMYHRPIGIGVQGLADAFVMMNIPFDSPVAQKLNKDIFKTIYYASLKESNAISKERSDMFRPIFEDVNSVEFNNFKQQISEDKVDARLKEDSFRYYTHTESGERLFYNEAIGYLNDYGYTHPKDVLEQGDGAVRNLDLIGSYSSFIGSPASEGILQYDMWKKSAEDDDDGVHYDWETLKQDIKKYGLRNSLLLAPMPTASTSQILGNNECFEPFTSNIYMRRTLAGNFMVVNKYLISELSAIGMWNEDVKNNIIFNKGSIQYIDDIPKCLKEKYKIVWEIPMRSLIDMAATRGMYICQSQSMNLWMEEATYEKLTAMHMYAWKKGLKTGIYYLRTKAKAAAQQFTIDPSLKNKNKSKAQTEDDDEGCLMCSG